MRHRRKTKGDRSIDGAAPLFGRNCRQEDERGRRINNENQTKGKAAALLPIGVFWLSFLGAGIVFDDFYAMPAIVAFLIALFVAFLQNRKSGFSEEDGSDRKRSRERRTLLPCA